MALAAAANSATGTAGDAFTDEDDTAVEGNGFCGRRISAGMRCLSIRGTLPILISQCKIVKFQPNLFRLMVFERQLGRCECPADRQWGLGMFLFHGVSLASECLLGPYVIDKDETALKH